MSKTLYFIGAIVLAVIILGVVTYKASAPQSQEEKDQAVKNVDPDTLAGIMTTAAPWQPQLDHLRERLDAIGLPALSAEGSALHIHEHLDIFVHGQPVTVPAGIGVNESQGFISDIHTHDKDAVIHVESPTVQTFTLGQFFDIWGVRFTGDCLGSYCKDANNDLKVFSNGQPVNGDPRAMALEERQEIVVAYGTKDELAKPMPSTFTFEAGL